jgi:hypothetical protein
MKLDKKYFCGIIIAAVSISLFLAGPLKAGPTLTNGDFNSSDLSVWSPDGNVVYDDVKENVILGETDAIGGKSSLSQGFDLPDNALTLSFEMSFYTPFVPPNCDEFTASLSGHVFYSRDSSGYVYHNEVTVEDIGDGWQRIILDVSSLVDPSVLLEFALLSGDTDVPSLVTLDNVVVDTSLNVIPAPGALLLAAMGAGLAGWLRKSGKLR